MNFNVTVCYLCRGLMTLRQVREGVYWLPDMDEYELSWAFWEGFIFKFAHQNCWAGLQEKRRALIRLCSFKNQEPQRLGQRV